MTRLTALSAASGLTPLDVAGTTLIETDPGPAYLISRYDPANAPDLAALKLSWPGPRRVSTGPGGVRLLSFGPDEALLLGASCPALAGAAACDVSDGWCHLRLDGPLAAAALARLIPLDLRPSVFGPDEVARSLLGRMPVVVIGMAGGSFGLMVWRSMAAGAVSEIGAALALVAARG